MTDDPERTLEFEFLRATENAALHAAQWLGRGEKEEADAAACDAIRGMFDLMDMRGEVVIVDRVIREGCSVIRGLHYVEDDPPRRPDKGMVDEDLLPLADILNPDAVNCFIHLVYQRYFDELGEHFGKTIKAIFTDEPSLFGKRHEPGAVPGNAGLLPWISGRLGYDFTPRLPALCDRRSSRDRE